MSSNLALNEEMGNMSNQFCSPRQAAALLHVSLGFIYTLLWGGKLRARKSRAGRWEILIAAIEARQRLQEARRAVEQAGR